ncbi:hypothetical protein QA600_07735 [Natronococcus sp. A-GB1]|uniref:hypothetical protein n=1 Tax=Natronococcus sp. A-GB1 TaxID=3037648 RepID=UPI00241E824B|nr:hypothetical protein [Natronococcus sp. A-GB1]MDG5759229.1 hypothetical protein [Natronococcus sp. A-GB1]
MDDDRNDVTALRIALRRELHRFFKRVVGLVVATVGILLGLAAMLLPFIVGFGSSALFGAGMLVATLCSWWILGATGSPDFEDLTDDLE